MSGTWVAAAPWIVVLLLVVAMIVAWIWINCAESQDEEDEWRK